MCLSEFGILDVIGEEDSVLNVCACTRVLFSEEKKCITHLALHCTLSYRLQI